MAENQGEVPKVGSAKAEGPKIPTPPTSEKMIQVGEALKKLTGTGEFQRQTREAVAETPEQEAVRRRREEVGGVEVLNQLEGNGDESSEEEPQGRQDRRIVLEPFNLTGPEPQDPQLRSIIERARQQIASDPGIGVNRSWLEGLYTEIGGVRANLFIGRNEVDRRIRGLYELRDRQNMSEAEFVSQYQALRGERDVIEGRIRETEAYTNRLLERAEQVSNIAPDHTMQERIERIIREIESVRERFGDYEARKRFKEFVGSLNVEDHISPDLLRIVARDEEVAERFLDAIISKPFTQPDVPYSQSFGFYASINRLAFLDAVRAIDPARHRKYGQMVESSERLHEMNRTILSESGNPDAFVGIARVITHQNLQTATELDGVEVTRHLYELAYGRLYAKTERVTGDNYAPEIEDWVARQFRELVQAGKVPSHYKGEDGQSRPIESWEADRALAVGRNITTAFYRQSELMSWSKIPLAWERWIESLPTEFVVRAMAGFKWFSYRFRIGKVSGGTELVTLIRDKIMENYDGALQKIGKLNIAEELYPVAQFKGAGFDKGWRIFQVYLRNDVMRIRLNPLPPLSDEDRARMSSQARKDRENLERFYTEFGYRPTLGDFLFEQEYMAQIKAAEDKKIQGVKIPEELQRFDSRKLSELLSRDVIPLTGFREATGQEVRDQNVRTYGINKKHYVYDESQDQINLNFGTLLSFGHLNETVRTMLWMKVADVLPLRMAYFLSENGIKGEVADPENPTNHYNAEEGVRGLLAHDRFRHLKGEGDNLFSDAFETKLLILQESRIRNQIQEQKEALLEGRQARKIGLNLNDPTIGFSDVEKEFVRLIQELSKRNAPALAKISFPHVAFHDDTTYQDADYSKVRGETFARRQGGDFSAFVTTNNEFNTIVGNLGALKYENVLEHLDNIRKQISTPENNETAQDVIHPILISYLEMGRQWTITKFPFVKTIVNALTKPTSHMQRWFGPNAPSDDESEINLKVRLAVEKQVQRRERLPHEPKSQADDILDELGGQWWNVFWRELRNAIILYLTLMAFEAGKKTVTEKT